VAKANKPTKAKKMSEASVIMNEWMSKLFLIYLLKIDYVIYNY
jgi:hypothetical protein